MRFPKDALPGGGRPRKGPPDQVWEEERKERVGNSGGGHTHTAMEGGEYDAWAATTRRAGASNDARQTLRRGRALATLGREASFPAGRANGRADLAAKLAMAAAQTESFPFLTPNGRGKCGADANIILTSLSDTMSRRQGQLNFT